MWYSSQSLKISIQYNPSYVSNSNAGDDSYLFWRIKNFILINSQTTENILVFLTCNGETPVVSPGISSIITPLKYWSDLYY